MQVFTEDFDPSIHTNATVAVLQRVRVADPAYPPAEAGSTDTELRSWLLGDEVLGRWVAVKDDTVVGHVQISHPHPYLVDHLEEFGYRTDGLGGLRGFAEIGKLFADPLAQGRGVGTLLLTRARDSSWAAGRQPALAVVTTSSTATRMYAREGMIEVGTFDGVHGINRVMIDPILSS